MMPFENRSFIEWRFVLKIYFQYIFIFIHEINKHTYTNK